MKHCLICDRIKQIKNHRNPHFVIELSTGYVVFGDHKFYKGYTLFLSKIHASELHVIDQKTRQSFLNEMSLVGEAVYKVFKPEKLNYELLGNKYSHMHWHIYPRHKDDPDPKRPIWSYPKNKRCNDNTVASAAFLSKYKPILYTELNTISNKSKSQIQNMSTV